MNIFKYETKDRVSTLKQLGQFFFKLVKNDQLFLEELVKSFELLEKIAASFSRRKRDFYDRLMLLNVEDCDELTALTEAEAHYQEVKKMYQYLSTKESFTKKEFHQLASFFIKLEGFLKIELIEKDKETKNIFENFLNEFSLTLRKKKQRFDHYLLTEKEWPDCPGGTIEGSPLSIYTQDIKLGLLLRRRLYDLLMSVFDVKTKQLFSVKNQWIHVDEKLFSLEYTLERED